MTRQLFVRISGIGLSAALAATLIFGAPAPAAAAQSFAQPAATVVAQQGPGLPALRKFVGRMLVRALVRATADATGQEVPAVVQALRDGNSLAAIAVAGGRSADDVVQTVVDKANERIKQAVDKGRITDEQAEQAITRITEKATEIMNNAELGSKLPQR